MRRNLAARLQDRLPWLARWGMTLQLASPQQLAQHHWLALQVIELLSLAVHRQDLLLRQMLLRRKWQALAST